MLCGGMYVLWDAGGLPVSVCHRNRKHSHESCPVVLFAVVFCRIVGVVHCRIVLCMLWRPGRA